MDWVKVYTIIMLTFSFSIGLIKDGVKRETTYRWHDGLIGAVLFLPFYGRIFGYW